MGAASLLPADPTQTSRAADHTGKHLWPWRVDTERNHCCSHCHFSQSCDFPSRLIYHRACNVAHWKPCACSAVPLILVLCVHFHPCFVGAPVGHPFRASRAAENVCSPHVLRGLFPEGWGRHSSLAQNASPPTCFSSLPFS